MAVKLIAPGEKLTFPLTSPPKLPDPVPDAGIAAKIIQYADRKVIVTYPFPDKISLVCDIMPQHLMNAPLTNKLTEQLKHVDNELSEWIDVTSAGGFGISEPTKNLVW